MTIGDIIKNDSPGIHKKLMQISKEKPKKKDVKLGDSVENLMKADSHKRVRGAIRQTKWK